MFRIGLWAVALLAVGCGRTGIEIADPKEQSGEDASAEGPGNDPAENPDGPPGEPEVPDSPEPESCGDGVVQRGELCFDQEVTFASRIDPCSIDIGDLDGDGHLDVAVPNSDFDHLESAENFASILYGDGRGGLSAPLQLAAGGDFAVGIAVGAFDSDRADDIVVSNSDTQEVNVIMGGGGRSFGLPARVDVGAGPVTVVAADFDSDGFDDVAVTVRDDGGVSVALGDGLGGIAGPARFYAGGRFTWGLEAADVDGDGAVDLIGTDNGASSLLLWLGVGDGTFLSASELGVGEGPYGITASDLDANGTVDLIAANNETSTVSVLFGDGAGGFGSGPALQTDAGPAATAVSDFNADGHVDIAVVSNVTEQVEFFLGDSRGAFVAARTYGVGSLPSGIRAGDFNEDGVDDIAISNQLDNNVGLILSNP